MVSSLDVAKKAGVSQATVSRVLNNSPKVSKRTKEKVLEAIKELNFHPNLIARSLVTNKNKTIALISGSINNDFYAETTESIVSCTTEFNYNVLVHFNEEILQEEVKYSEILDFIKGNNVSGVLFSSIFLYDSMLKELEDSKIPYMLFNRRPKVGGNYVVLDNVKAAEMLIEHLYELGHKKIAYISNPFENISTLSERKAGYDKSMVKFGLDNMKYVRCKQINEEVLKEILDDLLTLSEPPTAIFCTTDHMAITCMNILLSRGLSIPEDINVVGIDNNKISSHEAIQLTTVSHDENYNIGRIAVEKLFNIIEHPEENTRNIQVKLKPKLYKRRTTCILSK